MAMISASGAVFLISVTRAVPSKISAKLIINNVNIQDLAQSWVRSVSQL